MNRLEFPAKAIAISSSTLDTDVAFDVATLTHPRVFGTEAAPHATFSPMHYEAGYAYPLVIWLHGPQGTERELKQVMPLVSMRNYVAAAPRGTRSDRMQRGTFHWQQSCDGIEEAEARIFDCIAVAQRRFHIHSERIFLAGYRCGGTMALRVAWNNPGRFAGVATLGGPLPTELRPLRCVNQLRQVPCFLATSQRSRHYPEQLVCRDLRLLHAAGCMVALRHYPCGDELTTAMLSDLDRWTMEQVCGAVPG
jgi:phospholipase/carboxylesterase